jgi:hypothetical protein
MDEFYVELSFWDRTKQAKVTTETTVRALSPANALRVVMAKFGVGPRGHSYEESKVRWA